MIVVIFTFVPVYIKLRNNCGYCINIENVASGSRVNLGKLGIARVGENSLSTLRYFKVQGDTINQANR